VVEFYQKYIVFTGFGPDPIFSKNELFKFDCSSGKVENMKIKPTTNPILNILFNDEEFIIVTEDQTIIYDLPI